MRKRVVKFQTWLSREEKDILRKKACLVGMSESSLIRCWIKDIHPKEKPPPEFYDLINELRRIGINLNQIAHVANATHHINNYKYDINAEELNKIIKNIKETYL